jgi:hypothetical protein
MQPHPWNLLLQKAKTQIEAVAETTLQPYYLINIATGKTAMAAC